MKRKKKDLPRVTDAVGTLTTAVSACGGVDFSGLLSSCCFDETLKIEKIIKNLQKDFFLNNLQDFHVLMFHQLKIGIEIFVVHYYYYFVVMMMIQ